MMQQIQIQKSYGAKIIDIQNGSINHLKNGVVHGIMDYHWIILPYETL